MTDENQENVQEQKNFADQLDPKEVQSVTSNGVTVHLRTADDMKKAHELEMGKMYNPFAAMFGASKWGNMRKG